MYLQSSTICSAFLGAAQSLRRAALPHSLNDDAAHTLIGLSRAKPYFLTLKPGGHAAVRLEQERVQALSDRGASGALANAWQKKTRHQRSERA
jgi:hypothetical protein